MSTRFPIEQASKIIAEGLVPFGPRLHPCVCGAGQHLHGGKGNTGGCKETECARYRADLAYQLAYNALDAANESIGDIMKAWERQERAARRKANPKLPGQWSIGPSDAGTCRRKIMYREAPPEGYEPMPEDKSAARMGSIIHAETVRRMAALRPWQLFEQDVSLEGLDRPGRFDIYDPVTGIVDDVKTAGRWRWEQVGDHGPEEDTWAQSFLYGLALEDAGNLVTEIRLRYVARDHGHDEVFSRPYDRAFAVAERDKLIATATALDLGQELPRDRSGPSTDALCQRCEARVHCWGLDRAAELGRSGESLVFLGDPVDRQATEWAISQLVERRQVRLDAAKAETEAAALLDGVEPGDYGEYAGYPKRTGGGPAYKQRLEQVQEWWDIPADERPAFEAVATATAKAGTSVDWKRKRLATRNKRNATTTTPAAPPTQEETPS